MEAMGPCLVLVVVAVEALEILPAKAATAGLAA